ncbi:hypothetical protein B9G39_28435 [Zooshikella ganghwensis]|uniref:Uncharacterized protein n=1 Tax=Zooshikella ganghwensis TaxID=202772 RepID=A0A4P9VGB7_9GAMM|nr:hypothetical protein B9G39_28435 [Zooshikella ganghwensis]
MIVSYAKVVEIADNMGYRKFFQDSFGIWGGVGALRALAGTRVIKTISKRKTTCPLGNHVYINLKHRFYSRGGGS